MERQKRRTVSLTADLDPAAADLVLERAKAASVRVPDLLGALVHRALLADAGISPYADLELADLEPGDGEPDPLPVEPDPEGARQARWDAQADHDRWLFADRARHIAAAEEAGPRAWRTPPDAR
jgi:hypothetical protein